MQVRFLKKAMLVLGASWVATTTGAVAQDAPRQVGVKDRPRPEYDAVGIPAGGFTLLPTLDVAALFQDNVFSSQTFERDDTVAVVSPSLTLRSNWANHSLELNANSTSRFYNDFDVLNSTDYRLSANGRLDVVRQSSLNGGVSYFNGVESLFENPTIGLREPVQFDNLTTYVGGTWGLARARLSTRFQNDTYDYEDGRLFSNAVVEEDDRDRNVSTLNGRVDYSVSPDTSVFLSATKNWRDYDLAPPAVPVNRNSDGYEALIGVNFDVTRLLRGDFGIGYMEQNYEAPTISDDAGVAWRAQLEWFPTEVLTVTARSQHQIGDSGLAGTPSFVGTQSSLTADFELRRNVIVSADGAVYKEEYKGIARTDDRWSAGIGATYQLNRVAGLNASYRHWDYDSSGVAGGQAYESNDFMIGIRLRR
jgi:hypothetical protein